jgi:hypothetical protein
MKSLTLFLECFTNIQLLESKKFNLLKKKSIFSGLKKTTKVAWGGGGWEQTKHLKYICLTHGKGYLVVVLVLKHRLV